MILWPWIEKTGMRYFASFGCVLFSCLCAFSIYRDVTNDALAAVFDILGASLMFLVSLAMAAFFAAPGVGVAADDTRWQD